MEDGLQTYNQQPVNSNQRFDWRGGIHKSNNSPSHSSKQKINLFYLIHSILNCLWFVFFIQKYIITVSLYWIWIEKPNKFLNSSVFFNYWSIIYLFLQVLYFLINLQSLSQPKLRSKGLSVWDGLEWFGVGYRLRKQQATSPKKRQAHPSTKSIINQLSFIF